MAYFCSHVLDFLLGLVAFAGHEPVGHDLVAVVDPLIQLIDALVDHCELLLLILVHVLNLGKYFVKKLLLKAIHHTRRRVVLALKKLGRRRRRMLHTSMRVAARLNAGLLLLVKELHFVYQVLSLLHYFVGLAGVMHEVEVVGEVNVFNERHGQVLCRREVLIALDAIAIGQASSD